MPTTDPHDFILASKLVEVFALLKMANMLLAILEAFAGQADCGASLAWRERVFIRAEIVMSS